ncbi:MAG: hypothetical protein FWE36_02110 [Erysipelotrichales bacterium]|nr:hypothetical protein [Erysipelotrichales bacterium]
MKKLSLIFIFAFILILQGCFNKVGINEFLLVTSFALEYEEENSVFRITAFYPSNADIGKTDNNRGFQYGLIITEHRNLAMLFEELERSVDQKVELRHIQSVILHESFMNERNIATFLEFIRLTSRIPNNFFVFFTSEDIEEIYDTRNPDEYSMFHSIFNNPRSNRYAAFGLSGIHFINFALMFHQSYSDLILPKIEIGEARISQAGEEFNTAAIQRQCFIGESIKCYHMEEHKALFFLENRQTIIMPIDDVTLRLSNYRYNLRIERNVFVINIRAHVIPLINIENHPMTFLIEKLKEEMSRHFNELIELGIRDGFDFFGFRRILFQRHMDYTRLDYRDIELRINFNFRG